MATVVIGADICPIEGNQPYFVKGDATALFNDLLDEIQRADLAIANLECPLIGRPSPILKTGPVFGEQPACINGVKNAGIHVLALANNHIMDHGAAGLKTTLETCRQAEITTVGAGENLVAAGQILIREAGGIRISILAVAEHEFSIATKDSWGANPLDLIEFVRTVKCNRDRFDYLIVLLHGGDEFLVPSPRIKKTCQFMIEMGANIVVVQHPHCLGGWEEYQRGHIIYGQGALVMDEAIYRDMPSFHEGFLVKLEIGRDTPARMDIIPFIQSTPVPGARRMTPEREARFRKTLAERSAAVKDDSRVEANWIEFCETRKHAYVSGLLGHSRILRKLNQGGWITRCLYGKRPLLGVHNIVRCENHREAIETIFGRQMI